MAQQLEEIAAKSDEGGTHMTEEETSLPKLVL